MNKDILVCVSETDEAKSLFGIEPFDDRVDWWTRGYLKRLARPGSSAESTRLWVVPVNVEFATPRMPKILISQLWFLVGSCPISREERLAVALLRV